MTSTLIVEDGSGVQGADSYASQALITAYWAARSHSPLAATWTALATDAKMDGAAREATAYIDGTWGNFFRGVRKGYAQGLAWPRTGALDDAGFPLPDLPSVLQAAVAELAARAGTTPLAPDVDAGLRVQEETVGPITTRYFDAKADAPKITYGVVELLLAPLLNGAQPAAPNGGWAWG